jgi:hypothetical protein
MQKAKELGIDLKTSILRAIALSTVPVIEATALIAEMSGIQRRKNKKGVTSPESCIIAKFVDRSGKEEFSVTTKIVLGSDGKEMVIRETIPIDFPWDRVFSAGYRYFFSFICLWCERNLADASCGNCLCGISRAG